jgi:hypothetical protein
MKRLLILVGLLAGLALPGTAGAAAPCRNQIFNDWYHDGRIASTYPIGCYRDALKHIPADARIYSSLSGDIDAAMRAAIRREHGKVVPKQVGHGFPTSTKQAAGANGSPIAVGNSAAPHDPAQDPATAGAIADTTSSTPLPILVLAGIAIALAAAGAIGGGVRYARRRR